MSISRDIGDEVDNADENQMEVQNRINRLLETLIANKPNDRSELDKVYAIAITDTQRLWAWWLFSFEGLPPYSTTPNLPPFERRSAIPCPACGNLEDMRVKERTDGGLDYHCYACGDSGILDKA